jgi:uncharacterized RDD family membrane protein YckC
LPDCKRCGNEIPEGAKYCPVCGAAVAVEEAPAARVAPGVSAAPGLKLAYWWERFVAWLIDVVVVAFALAIISFFTFLLGQPFAAFTNYGLPSWTGIFFSFSLSSIILFVYWTLMEGLYGQSFGKMVMRIRVTGLDGGRVDMGRAAVASVGKAFFLFLDVLLGWFLYPRRRQRVFNYLSGTIVTKIT